MTRITLDRPRTEDIPRITAAMQAPETAQWLSSVPQPYGIADAEAFVTTTATPGEHAIRVDGTFAGMVRGGPDLGYWLTPEFQGRGIATRAAVLALSRSFAAGQSLIGAQVMDGNGPSQAVLARLGFQPVGRVQIHSPTRGVVPGTRHHLTLPEFAAAQPVHLTTERCEIGPVRETDLADLRAIATQGEVARMLFLFYPDMPEGEFATTHPEWTGLPPFRCTVRQGGRIIGSVGVGALGDGAGHMPPVFYYLTPEVAGRGIASEVVPAFCDMVLQRFGLAGLTAGVFDDNPASARVLEKAGFTRGAAMEFPTRGRSAPAAGHHFTRVASDRAADKAESE
ncbi:GNAT N-acetyltransferase [Paracoccus suum]|uniref:GNAT N-acetyltransferase n=1 Tax=Paracoccus suum TaxID=2259340 RepID=A0A344PKM6_9RHOB|nr:GNAT family N-acetyltransferase [Paracoccus suum]AXC49931.1 GNAT N-acetyltransferase [Paracoccus suum]